MLKSWHIHWDLIDCKKFIVDKFTVWTYDWFIFHLDLLQLLQAVRIVGVDLFFDFAMGYDFKTVNLFL